MLLASGWEDVLMDHPILISSRWVKGSCWGSWGMERAALPMECSLPRSTLPHLLSPSNSHSYGQAYHRPDLFLLSLTTYLPCLSTSACSRSNQSIVLGSQTCYSHQLSCNHPRAWGPGGLSLTRWSEKLQIWVPRWSGNLVSMGFQQGYPHNLGYWL